MEWVILGGILLKKFFVIGALAFTTTLSGISPVYAQESARLEPALNVVTTGFPELSKFDVGQGLTTDSIDPSIQMVAHKAYNVNTPIEERNRILAARYAIVYGNTRWTVNGAIKLVDLYGNTQLIPEFTDLFPDWNLADIREYANTLQKDKITTSPYAANFNNNVFFDLVGSEDAPTFYSWNSGGKQTVIIADTAPGSHYNAGVKNLDSDTDVGWIPNIEVGTGITLDYPSTNTRYGARVSSPDKTGYGRVRVYE